jgi:HSP90 family molecular chaperone
MADALDEYVLQSLTEFDGTPLQSITKDGLEIDLGENEKERMAKLKETFTPLTDYLGTLFGSKVEKVVVSTRIAQSPCVLVSTQYGWTANMERIMKAQTFAQADDYGYLNSKKIMEINPRHPIIKEMLSKVVAVSEESKDAAAEEGKDAKQALVSNPALAQMSDLAELLYDNALLSSGYQVKDLQDFSKRIQRVISNGLNIDPSAEVEPEADDQPEAEKAESEEEKPSHDEL